MRMKGTYPEKPGEILKLFSMVNAQVLQQLPVQIKNEQLDAAVNLLAKADNIYVIGLRRSFSVASYLTYALRHLERRAFLIDGIGGMFSEQLSMVSPDDVVIAISYSPYAQEVVELVELGAKRGAHHIAITDSESARWQRSVKSVLWYVKRRSMVSVLRSRPCVWRKR